MISHLNTPNLSVSEPLPSCCFMMMRTAGIFLFFALAALATAPAAYAVATGEHATLKLTEIDGRHLSIGDGVVTTLILTTRSESNKARLVGDRTPERCLGNPEYRMVTVVQFAKSTSGPVRYLLTQLAKSRLNTEAERLKPRYRVKKLTNDPRQDIHVVFDFDGGTASQLGLKDSPAFRVFVFGPDGTLRGQWTAVPDAHELDAALQ